MSMLCSQVVSAALKWPEKSAIQGLIELLRKF